MRDMDRKKPGNLSKIRRFAFSGFFFLFSVALIVQVLLSSAGLRHQEEQTAKMESLSQAMSTKMQKLSKEFLAASREAKGDVVSDMAAIQKRSPGASDLRWWDRGVLDSAYGSKEKASSFGFARLADAERLMAGNEKLLSFSSFARIPNVQEPVIVLSARSGERVIQVLTPSTDVLDFFKSQVPEGVVAALVQDGKIVSLAGGSDLDLNALDVVTVGTSRVSIVYLPVGVSGPWLGDVGLQWMVIALFLLLGLVLTFLPRIRRVVPGKKNAPVKGDEVLAPINVFRPAAVTALPSSSRQVETAESTEVVSESSSGPTARNDFSIWFSRDGLVFKDEPGVSLPDSSQMRGLVRGLLEELGSLVGKTVVIAIDGGSLSTGLAKWSVEAFSGAGCRVMMVDTIALASVPFLFDRARELDDKVGALIWFGSSDEQSNESRCLVYEASGFWKPESYARWRLRMTESFKPLDQDEGSVTEVDVSTLIEPLIERVAFGLQVDKPLRVVVDFGNGPLALIAPAVWEAVGIEIIPLHGDVDPTRPNQLARGGSGWSSLSSTVRQFRAGFGVGVSLDGRSIVLLTEDGLPVSDTQLAALVASDVLTRHPGVKVEFTSDFFDIELLSQAVREAGGIPVPKDAVGVNGPLNSGVELVLSANKDGLMIRFGDDFGAPNAIYAVARIAVLLSMEDQSLADRIFAVLPSA